MSRIQSNGDGADLLLGAAAASTLPVAQQLQVCSSSRSSANVEAIAVPGQFSRAGILEAW
jgi:hypothetical protein